MPPRVPKIKETYEDLLRFALDKKSSRSSWTIIGLDPSMSRSGISKIIVDDKNDASVTFIGSIEPKNRSDEDFIRAKAQTAVVQSIILEDVEKTKNLMISLEAPTPGNDYLISINRILKTGISAKSVMKHFDRVVFMHTNASTLRSCFGLVKTGNNKGENIEAAYSIVTEKDFPGIDSDACDALLIGMMGRYAISIINGCADQVPEKFLKALLSKDKVDELQGSKRVPVDKGIMYRDCYWYEHPKDPKAEVIIRDAVNPKGSRLKPVSINL